MIHLSLRTEGLFMLLLSFLQPEKWDLDPLATLDWTRVDTWPNSVNYIVFLSLEFWFSLGWYLEWKWCKNSRIVSGYNLPGGLKSRECQSTERGEWGRDAERSRAKRQKQSNTVSILLHILVALGIPFSSIFETLHYLYNSLYFSLKLTRVGFHYLHPKAYHSFTDKG